MKLKLPNHKFLNQVMNIYKKTDGNIMNNQITKLFKTFNSNDDIHEVKIKAVCLNQIYSTSIFYIDPVVKKLVNNIPKDTSKLNTDDFIKLVDKIKDVTWHDKNNKIRTTRTNLSFASKYIHFLSGYKTPIYDSYIWLIMIGFLRQNGHHQFKYTKPKSFKEFYQTYLCFINEFSINGNAYNLDKFLWQYARNLLDSVSKKNRNISISKAKTILKSKIETDVNSHFK